VSSSRISWALAAFVAVTAPALLAARPAGADLFQNLTVQGDMYPKTQAVYSITISAAKRDYADPVKPDVTAGSVAIVGGLQAAGFFVHANAGSLQTWQIKQYWHARLVSSEFQYQEYATQTWYWVNTIVECTQYGTRGQLGFRIATTGTNGQVPDATITEVSPEHPLATGAMTIYCVNR